MPPLGGTPAGTPGIAPNRADLFSARCAARFSATNVPLCPSGQPPNTETKEHRPEIHRPPRYAPVISRNSWKNCRFRSVLNPQFTGGH